MLYLLIVFLLAFVLTAYIHAGNNRHYFSQWKKLVGVDTAIRLNQLAWARTTQVLASIAGGVIAVLLLHYMHTEQTNEQLASSARQIEQQLAELKTMQEQLVQQQAMQQKNPQIEISAHAVDPEPPTALAPASGRDAASEELVTLSDIYNPEELSNDQQSAIDAIKKRYEGLLVNYLFLKQCGMIDARDYHAIISTLAGEMASVNAPGRLEHDIMTAARGSYHEMYAGSDCKGPETANLHAQYSSYIKTISDNIPTP